MAQHHCAVDTDPHSSPAWPAELISVDKTSSSRRHLKLPCPCEACGVANRRLLVACLSDGPPLTFIEEDGCLSVCVFVWMVLRIADPDLLCRCGVTFLVKT